MKANPNRPIIGINSDLVPAGKFTNEYACLRAGYFEAVVAAGGLPLILPPLTSERELRAALDCFDGMILSGGLDMDPRRQKLPMHPSVQPMAAKRDLSDQALVRCLLQKELPVLAIGLGMQQLNIVCGGSLYWHLPSDLPRAMPHRDSSGGPHRHAVVVEPGTRLEEIYGGGEIRVNSDHHQAVQRLGSGLRISARSSDGVIEAIETTKADWFCIAVQWHPESETASALDKQLFDCFIKACSGKAQMASLAA
jgi:putative glutamine amidotransferase